MLTYDVEGDTLREKMALNLKGIGTITMTADSSEEKTAEVTLPEISGDNAVVLQVNGFPEEQQALATLAEEYGRGALKYLQKLMNEDAELAALLEKAGLTTEMLEEAIENGDFSFGPSATIPGMIPAGPAKKE